MMDFIKDIALVILGAIGTVIWFFWRRKVEQKRVFENIQKAEKLLLLRKELDKTNYTIEDLKSLEDALMGRAEVAKELGASFEKQAEEIRRIQFNSAMTQTEMNIVAAQVYERAERKLETIIAELKEYLSPEEIAKLDETNEAWRNYQRKHAELLASQYEGGSIQPLIYSSALESLTIARIVELETELKQLKDMCVPYRERDTF
jgi:uncharacterized protein YecT (DUF1311 family)